MQQSQYLCTNIHAHFSMNTASHHIKYLLILLQLGVINPESTLDGIQIILAMANDTGDRSSTNLNTVTNTLQIVAENSSISVSIDVLESATMILSTIQDWGMDNSTLDILQNSSAEYVMLTEEIFSCPQLMYRSQIFIAHTELYHLSHYYMQTTISVP